MTPRDRVVRLGLRIFGRLPRRVRRTLVRLGSPSYYVGAIGAVVVDGELLLVSQTYRSGLGLPGGLLGRGELPVDGVVREIREEAGIEVVTVGPPAVVVEPAYHRVDVCFRCEPAPRVAKSSAHATSPEIDAIRWVPLTELAQLQPEAVGALRALGYEVPDGAGISPQPRRTPP